MYVAKAKKWSDFISVPISKKTGTLKLENGHENVTTVEDLTVPHDFKKKQELR